LWGIQALCFARCEGNWWQDQEAVIVFLGVRRLFFPL